MFQKGAFHPVLNSDSLAPADKSLRRISDPVSREVSGAAGPVEAPGSNHQNPTSYSALPQ